MTIEKWLADVHYDNLGTCIWNRQKDGGNQMIADIRGWGAIQNEFKTNEEAEKFQDGVGEFIVQAIREKIARTSSQTDEKGKPLTYWGGVDFTNPNANNIKSDSTVSKKVIRIDDINEEVDELIRQNELPKELSDEEIEKGAKEWYNKEGAYSASAIALKTWVYAIRWYREQLKK